MKRISLSLFVAGLLLLSPLARSADNERGLSRTETTSAAERRTALVIGNSQYIDSPLRNPANDARAMREALQSAGFEVLYGIDLSFADMMTRLDEFGERSKASDVALFYYAGHGVQVHGQNYLIPVNTRLRSENEVRYKTVPTGLLLAKLEDARSRINIVILDACRNNPFARSFRSLSQGLAQMDAPSGTLIAYATAPGKVASDGSGDNGLYTEALLRYIKNPELKVEDVFKKVRLQVMQATANQQTPWESSSLTGDFYFYKQQRTFLPSSRPAASEAGSETANQTPVSEPDTQAAELQYWQSVAKSDDADMLQSYLNRYPEGIFAEIARLKLQSLQKSRTDNVSEQQTRDERYRQLIIGSWENNRVTAEGAALYLYVNYLPDQTWNLTGTIAYQNQQFPLLVSGTWNIENRYLHYRITRSSMPQLLPVNYASASQIISMDENTLVAIDNGETITSYRATARPNPPATMSSTATNSSVNISWSDNSLNYQGTLLFSGQLATINLQIYDRSSGNFLTNNQQQIPVINTATGATLSGTVPIQWDSNTPYPHSHDFHFVIQNYNGQWTIQNCLQNNCTPVNVY